MTAETKKKLNKRQYGLIKRCAKKKDTKAWNDWREAHPRTAIHLVGADLDNASLEKADLKRADLRAANLQGAILAGANLREANLSGAMLFGADLRNADFQGASLYGADLSGANLEGANLVEANLAKTDFKGAKLPGVRLAAQTALDELAHPLTDQQIALVVFAEKEVKKSEVTTIQEAPPEVIRQDPPQIIQQDHQQAVPKVSINNNRTIVRSILFDRENLQAGIGILNYFTEILRQKYEDSNAKVIIEQEGLNVRLSIETADGKKRVIEKALENYITVVTGRETIANFLPEPLAGLAFKQKLDLVHLELKQCQALHAQNIANREVPVSPEMDNKDRLYSLLSENICISRD